MRRLVPAVLVLLLTGCGSDGPEPRFAPAAPSSTPSGTPTSPTASGVPTTAPPTAQGPVEPALPPDAQGDGGAAAAAFVRHFWDLVDYAQATGDVAGLEALAGPGCETCHHGSDAVGALYAVGGTLTGGETAVEILATSRAAGDRFEIRARVSNTRQVVRRPGTPKQVFPADSIRARFVVARTGTGWQVVSWESTL